MKKSVHISLKVLLVSTWVFMLVGYIAIFFAYTLFGEKNDTAIVKLCDICWILAIFNFLIIVLAGFSVNLWNMLEDYEKKPLYSQLLSALYILFASIYFIPFFYSFQLFD